MRHLLYNKNCKYCGKHFTASRIDAEFDSDACTAAYRRNGNKGKLGKVELKGEIARIVKPGMSTTEIFKAAIESNNPKKSTMEKLENLTKENFWNNLQAKYPKGMKVFCDWIDEYKKANDWNMLFNSDSEYQNAAGKNAPAPKYHDLPLAMQMGIWFEFVCDRGGCEFEIEDMFSFDLRHEITEYIIMLEAE